MAENGRNYLKEAYAIAEGKSMLLPEVEHLQILVERITDLESGMRNCQILIERAIRRIREEKK